MGLKGANDCIPCILKGLYTFAQCAVLCIASSICCLLFRTAAIRSWRVGGTRTKDSIFSLEFANASLQG